MQPLYIFLDTNVVKKHNPNLTTFEFNETYHVLKSFVVENELENIKVLVPRIVIEELISQYISEYKSTVDQLSSEINKIKIVSEKVGWEIDTNKGFDKSLSEYREHIKIKVDEFIEEEKSFLEIVEFPDNSKLAKIIERSVKKKKPFFSGKHNKKNFSDAGFKDVIFLESVIEYFEEYDGEYLIVTRDNYFHEIDLNAEFNGINGSLINKETGKELTDFLVDKLGVEDLSTYRQFAKTDYYKSAVNKALNCNVLGDPVNINKYEVDDIIFIEILSLVRLDGEEISIVVRISEEKEFIEILNDNKEEVICEWKY